jgi:8-oxo-dGTP pyrophosphatase MutT (NUDIX family)
LSHFTKKLSGARHADPEIRQGGHQRLNRCVQTGIFRPLPSRTWGVLWTTSCHKNGPFVRGGPFIRQAWSYHATMVKTAQGVGTQFAALPFRVTPEGLRVLLLTSRETRRWIIPKGWPIHGLKPRDVAAREAFEEGGLVGRLVGKHPIGSYHYSKRLPDYQDKLCYVRVFLLRVDHQVDEWPEKEQREWRWVDPIKAASMVDEGGLAEIIRSAFPAIGRLESKKKQRRLPL